MNSPLRPLTLTPPSAHPPACLLHRRHPLLLFVVLLLLLLLTLRSPQSCLLFRRRCHCQPNESTFVAAAVRGWPGSSWRSRRRWRRLSFAPAVSASFAVDDADAVDGHPLRRRRRRRRCWLHSSSSSSHLAGQHHRLHSSRITERECDGKTGRKT